MTDEEPTWDDFFYTKELEMRITHLEEMMSKLVTLLDVMNEQINSFAFIGTNENQSYYQPRNRRGQ